MATCALLALAASSLGWVAPGVQPLRARVQPIRRTAVIRSDGLEAEPFSLASSRQRMADSYREGVEKSRRYFKSDRFAAAESFAPLRGSDRIACVFLTIFFTEAFTFGASLFVAWLSVEGCVAAPQARLVGACAAAVRVRSRTRLPRLLAEILAMRPVARMVKQRDVDARAGFVKDRSSQALAILAVGCLTIRAANTALLSGSTAPAAAVLVGKVVSLFGSPSWAQPVIDSAAAAVANLGRALVDLDGAARASCLLAPAYFASELERHLAVPGCFAVRALKAWYAEVVLPLLRLLGFVTMQTLG